MYLEDKKIEEIKRNYPVGTYIVLDEMNDIQAPPVGTIGKVVRIDDTGTIFCRWNNGSGLGLFYGIDKFHKLEKEEK